jgi:hypothetical protein
VSTRLRLASVGETITPWDASQRQRARRDKRRWADRRSKDLHRQGVEGVPHEERQNNDGVLQRTSRRLRPLRRTRRCRREVATRDILQARPKYRPGADVYYTAKEHVRLLATFPPPLTLKISTLIVKCRRSTIQKAGIGKSLLLNSTFGRLATEI